MIAIPQSVEKRLRQLAKRSACSIDDLAREAIEQYIEDAEDIYNAERILRRVRAGREGTYTLDDVAKRIGLTH